MQATTSQPQAQQPSPKDIYLGHLTRAKNRYAECLAASRELWATYYTEEELQELPQIVKDTATTFFIECNRKMN